MKTNVRFYLVVLITVLAVILLLTPRVLADGAIPFTEHTVAGDFDAASSVYATDLDDDGDVDVLGAAAGADEIAWWENDGNENFTKYTITSTFDYADSVYAVDVDSDGDVDVLGAAYYADDIVWWENDGNENFSTHTITGTFDGLYSVYATDVDGDGDMDVLGAAYPAPGAIAWWENDGTPADGGWGEHTIAGNFSGASSVYATDVDGDGDVDVLGAAYFAENITWWENNGSESFTEHTIDHCDGARSVYATDLDGDGDMDVLGTFDYSESFTDGIAWWENNGSESFTMHTISAHFAGAYSVYAADVDNDGDVDILGAAFDYDEITWWENDGDENFTEHIITGNFDGARSVYATDVDGDGDVDVLGAAFYADDITWWEQLSRLSISDVSVTEGDSGSVNAVFSVTLSMTSTKTITVEYATADGSAIAPADYTAIPTTTLTFPPGVATRFITVSVQGDAVDEMDETFWVNLANPVHVSLSDAQGQITILDDDGFVVYLPLVLRNAGPPLPPVLDDISNSDGDGNYTVSWSTASGATSYTLEEDDNADFTSPDTAYSGSGTSKSISGKDVGTYYYRVKASNSFGSSDWSNTESVTVTVPPPPCPQTGAWSGTTNQGRSISFDVADTPECQVEDLTISFQCTCTYGWYTSYGSRFIYPKPITDNHFEAYGSRVDVIGDFTSSTTAGGTWNSSFYDANLGWCSGSGTWTADYSP